MKSKSLILLLFFSQLINISAQDTFSIVAADSTTREVGSAGASCVDLFLTTFTDDTFIGDLLPDTGAINTQASYITSNQNNARARMRAGDSPSQIISWLSVNDAGSNSTIRQYGITAFTGVAVSAEGFTGVNCTNYKNHKTGSINGIYYSIQGNILLGQLVIDSMEVRFRNAEGDLACRLMAALQGAKMVGADTRCTSNGTSSLFAYVKVAQPTDTYGSPSFTVSVRTHGNAQIEPVDTLQSKFDIMHSCVAPGINDKEWNNFFKVYPNPTDGRIGIFFENPSETFNETEIIIYNLLGAEISRQNLVNLKTNIDLDKSEKGIYFYQIADQIKIIQTGKIVVQ
jgi:uncharacterized Ntn-hydrolase superfamily protein